jgi:hypothetical protein
MRFRTSLRVDDTRDRGRSILTRGLKLVAGEAALSVLACNIDRAINLAGSSKHGPA